MGSRVAIASLLAFASLAAGCEADHGYVEVKTSYVIRPGDVYWIGDKTLAPGPGGQIDAVLGAEVGTLSIYIRRGDARIAICGVTVTKNRIVTVTIDRGTSGGVCNVVA